MIYQIAQGALRSNERLGQEPKTGAQAKQVLAFKARKPAHSKLCNGFRNAEGGRKDKQDGISF